jgi:serine/threonine protein kinase
MIDQELRMLGERLKTAAHPEDVFGELKAADENGLPALKSLYRSMAKMVHPDMYWTAEEKLFAQESFALLAGWYGQAQEEVRLGRYGRGQPVLLRTRDREYEVCDNFTQDDRFNFYDCTFREGSHTHPAVLRVTRSSEFNELSQNELRILRILGRGTEAPRYSSYLPGLLDAFTYQAGSLTLQAAVFEKYDGWYSVQQVHDRYPSGIDSRDMAWIWRRLLVILGFAHRSSVIHAAVLPANIYIQSEQHGLMLCNWHYSVYDPARSGEMLAAVNASYPAWYPAEVRGGDSPVFGTDIAMSAKCMIYLLGGDGENRTLPAFIPTPVQMFLRGSSLPGRRAPQDAWALLQEFDELLERLWGERKFHPFEMSFTH